MSKIILRPSGQIIEGVSKEKNVLEVLREQDVYIKSSCGGNGSCSDCVVKIVSGEDHLNPQSFQELKLLGNVYHITKERLSCQLKIHGDVTLNIEHHNRELNESSFKQKTKSFAQKMKSKNSSASTVKVIKSSDVESNQQARHDAVREKNQEEQSQKTPVKKLDGGRRPKFFSTDGLENLISSPEVRPGKKFQKVDHSKKTHMRSHEKVQIEKKDHLDSTETSENTFQSFRNKKQE